METINVNGQPVSYRLYGSGEPVVALHSSASSSAQWEQLGLDMFRGFQVAAPDLFGHGDSTPWPGLEPYSLSGEAALARAVIDKYSQPVHLVGHSYGGALALRLALEAPERLRSLTLIEPVSIHLLRTGDTRDRRLYAQIDQVAAEMTRGVVTGHHDAAMRRFIEYWNGEGAWPGLRESRRAALRSLSAMTLLHFNALSGELTPLAAHRRIGVPVLLMRGGQTRQVTARITDLLAANLADVSKVVVENAGHMLPITHPGLVNAAIRGHITEYSVRGQRGLENRRAIAA